jgi:hypothetical protein
MDLPDWLAVAVERVLSDMQDPTPLVLAASYEHTPTDAPGWGTLRLEDPSGAWFWLEVPEPSEGSPTGLVIRIAEELPMLVSELHQSWGKSRPGCPGHTHPAAAGESDGAAWWVCPRDRRLLGRVGTLGPGRNA